MFYSYGDNNAFEFSNGETIKLGNHNFNNERPIKFISYSNMIKPEIQKIYHEIGVVENHKDEKFFKILCGCYWRV